MAAKDKEKQHPWDWKIPFGRDLTYQEVEEEAYTHSADMYYHDPESEEYRLAQCRYDACANTLREMEAGIYWL